MKNNNKTAAQVFWELLGRKAAEDGIDLSNNEKEPFLIHFSQGIKSLFFKGWAEKKEEQMKENNSEK